jgi:hypothetical protein
MSKILRRLKRYRRTSHRRASALHGAQAIPV